MDNIEREIEKKFGRRLRLRVNGVLVEEGKLLMIRHRMSKDRFFWDVPGGGMEYGSNVIDNLKREFKEETGLEVSVGGLLCVNEFFELPLHAVELYFEVKKIGGSLNMGKDPELSDNCQIITDLAFLTIEELKKIQNEEKHRLFWELNSLNDIRMWTGYFNFENNCIK